MFGINRNVIEDRVKYSTSKDRYVKRKMMKKMKLEFQLYYFKKFMM